MPRMLPPIVACIAALLVLPSAAPGQDDDPAVRGLVRALADAEERPEALRALIARGETAAPALARTARDGQIDAVHRGWALVALGHVGGQRAVEACRTIARDEGEEGLVRAWAVVSLNRADPAEGAEVLLRLASGGNRVRRAPGRLVPGRATPSGNASTGSPLARVCTTLLTEGATDPSGLVAILLGSSDQGLRRRAAAYLGNEEVGGSAGRRAVIEALAYPRDDEPSRIPWAGGPLFIPGGSWTEAEARELIRHLVAWQAWIEVEHGRRSGPWNQARNGIFGGLARRTPAFLEALGRIDGGRRSPGWMAPHLATAWARAYGNEHPARAVRLLLRARAHETGAGREALRDLTGEDHGRDAGAWREALRRLEHDR